MLNRLARPLCLALIASLGASMAACTTREPLFIDAAFAAEPPATITVMPAVDARIDKSGHDIEDLPKVVRSTIEGQLKRKKYTVVHADGFAGSPHDEALAEMTDEELAALGPGDGNPMFIYFLEDIDVNYAVMTKTAKYQGRAVLLDPETGAALWRDREAGSIGQGGLVSGLIPMGHDSVRHCCLVMLRSMPKRSAK